MRPIKSFVSAPARMAVASFGIAMMVLGGPANAQDAVKLADGVEPHPEIDALYQQVVQAVSSLDSNNFSPAYGEDVFYLAPEAPLAVGLDEFKATWDGWFDWMKEGNGTLAMEFTIVAREVHNDTIGFDIGFYQIVQRRPNEADVTYKGKIVSIPKKYPDGAWRFRVDTYSFLEKME